MTQRSSLMNIRMLLSGFAMVMQRPKYRDQALSAMAAGLVLFLVTILNS